MAKGDKIELRKDEKTGLTLFKNVDYDPSFVRRHQIEQTDGTVLAQYDTFETALNYYNHVLSFGLEKANEYFTSGRFDKYSSPADGRTTPTVDLP